MNETSEAAEAILNQTSGGNRGYSPMSGACATEATIHKTSEVTEVIIHKCLAPVVVGVLGEQKQRGNRGHHLQMSGACGRSVG